MRRRIGRGAYGRVWREERKRQSVMSLHFILKIIPLKVVVTPLELDLVMHLQCQQS